MSNISSPCIRHCTLNAEDVCMGCFRNVDEILRWADATPEEKRLILQRVEALKAINNQAR